MVIRLALSYKVEISEMVPIPFRDLSTTALGKMQVLVRGMGKQWRIPNDDIMEPIRQVESKDIPEPAFERHQRSRHVKPDQPEPTLHDVM